MRTQKGRDPGNCHEEVLAHLWERVQQVYRAPLSPRSEILSTGSEALDLLLPDSGIIHGSLVEWVGGSSGLLSLLVAKHLCGNDGQLMIVDRQRSFYPPSAAAWGIDLNRVVVIHPADAQEELWAYDQCLRSEGVSVVWGCIERLNSHNFRRLQLTAEKGSGIGFLIRPPTALKEPTWADVRLRVEPLPSGGTSPRYRVKIVHCRGRHANGEGAFVIDETGIIHEAQAPHETHHVHLAPPLADSTPHHCESGT